MSESVSEEQHCSDEFPNFRRCLPDELDVWEEIPELCRMFTYTFCIAIECDSLGGMKNDPLSARTPSRTQKFTRPTPAVLRPQYFHIEYYPSDEEHTISTDAVIFSTTSAKVYPSGLAPKAVIPWRNGNKLWVAWTETVTIKFTEDRIEKILQTCQKGGIKFKIWDRKDKCGIQTRFDRPRSFGTGSESGVEETVKKIAKFCNRAILYADSSDITCCDEITGGSVLGRMPLLIKETSVSEPTVPTTKAIVKRRPTLLAVGEKPNKTVPSSHPSILKAKPSRSSKPDALINALGSCCLVLNLAHCFGKQQPEMLTACKPTIVTRPMTTALTGSVCLTDQTVLSDMVIALQLEQPLLTDAQCEHYKPVVFQVNRIKRLPTQPYGSHKEMQEHCEPLQMKWQMGNLLHYNSHTYSQERDIRVHDIQVVLTGLHSNERIMEFLLGTSFIVDFYDRVPKQTVEHAKNKIPSAFGCEPKDGVFGMLSKTRVPIPQVANRWVPSTAFTVDRHPYGRATVYLGETLTWHRKIIRCSVPVLQLSETDFDMAVATRTSKENLRKMRTDYVGYLESNCEMSVSIDFNFNLNALKPSLDRSTPVVSTVKRFICLLNKTDEVQIAEKARISLEELKQFIIQTNGRSLGVPVETPIEGIERILRSFRMNTILSKGTGSSRSSMLSPDNMWITGIHLSDSHLHFVILEAENPAVAEQLHKRLEAIRESLGMYLFENSSIVFTDRLYVMQDWCIPERSLSHPVCELVRQPLIHVRDLVPRLTYCAVHCIQTIVKTCTSLMDVVRMNLFPTTSMVDSLLETFSIPALPDEQSLTCASENLKDKTFEQSPVAAMNEKQLEYSTVLQFGEGSTTNVDKNNIRGKSPSVRHHTGWTLYRSPNVLPGAPYNYSIQKLNSAVVARCELWERFAQGDIGYTYSHEFFHSGSFEATNEPIDFPSLLRA